MRRARFAPFWTTLPLMRLPALALLAATLLCPVAGAQVNDADLPRDNIRGRFLMHGVAPTKPIHFAADRPLFYIANQMGDRLTAIHVETQARLLEVPTGSGLASIQARPGTPELWLVDRVTSSVTVFDTDAVQIVRTVRVGAEPHDLVFNATGTRAYVACSAVDRVDVIDASSYAVAQSIPIPARQPRALARIGTSVFVAATRSGNGTAPLGPAPGAEPTAIVRVADVPGATPLPDRDLFRIQITASPSTDALDPTSTVSGLGTTLLNLHARPGTSELWIPGTDALNAEHQGEKAFVAGQVARNQIAIVNFASAPPTTTLLDMDALAPSPAERASIPSSVAFTPDGSRAFVTGYGTDRVAVLDLGAPGGATWAGSITIPPVGQYPEFSGPRSAAVSPDGAYLVTYNKVDNGYSRIPLAQLPASTPFVFDFQDSRSIGYHRMPTAMQRGRGFFDRTTTSLSNTSACFTCHPDGDTDGLAWDLSTYLDPEGTAPGDLQFGVDVKGPMVTQSVRALREIGPYHWRGERPVLQDFDATFDGLFEHSENGQPATLGFDFFYIQQYLEELAPSPNPNQSLDRSYTPAQLTGADLFLNHPVQDQASCSDCHMLPLGTTNEIVETLQGGDSPSIVVPALRGVSTKLSRLFSPGAGFGEITELGAGLGHGGVAANIEAVALELDEAGAPLFAVDSVQARRIASFVAALDTGLAPSTAFQVTAHAGNFGEVRANQLPFLIAQAQAGHCELIYLTSAAPPAPQRFATGLFDPATGRFRQASVLLPDLTPGQVLDFALDGRPVTFLGVAGLRGKVMGIDRDNDDLLDLDELQAGTNPEAHDTDFDGMPDGYELEWGLDPLTPDGPPADGAAPQINAGPEVVYTTQTSVKFEFETSEPARVLFYVDGTPSFRRPLDQEFDTRFSYVVGGLSPQTQHVISMDLTDPAGNVSTFQFPHQSASYVRPVPFHVQTLTGAVIPDPSGQSGGTLRVQVLLGNDLGAAPGGYAVQAAVYHLAPGAMTVVASSTSASTSAAGSASLTASLPASLPSGSGELLVVIQDVDAPTGLPSYVEAGNSASFLTLTY